MSKIILNLTLQEAAKQLRNWAELTSKGSKNWDNFEGICLDVLISCFEHKKIAPEEHNLSAR